MKLKELKAELVDKASKLENPNLEVRLCIEKALGMSLTEQLLYQEREISDKEYSIINTLLNTRLSGIPMAYILGYKEFYGHTFKVTEDTLIPRPDTELIVEESLKIAKTKHNPRILDLCTGTGAIAASIAYDLNSPVSFSDISPKALEVAKYNYKNITGQEGCGRLGSLFEPWENDKFDIIVTNPPYLTRAWYEETEIEVKKEPELALIDDAEDGLDIIRAIINTSPDHLNSNGYLFIEGDYRQMEKCAKLLSLNGFKDVHILKDLANKDRVVYGRRD